MCLECVLNTFGVVFGGVILLCLWVFMHFNTFKNDTTIVGTITLIFRIDIEADYFGMI